MDKMHSQGAIESAETILNLQEQLKEVQQALEDQQTIQNSSQEDFAKLFEKKQATWKKKNQKIRDDFKELVKDYERLQAEKDQESEEHKEVVKNYEQQL